MASSLKYRCIVSLSFREESRSMPNGFSTMTRAPWLRWAVAMPSAIRPNSTGGTSR